MQKHFFYAFFILVISLLFVSPFLVAGIFASYLLPSSAQKTNSVTKQLVGEQINSDKVTEDISNFLKKVLQGKYSENKINIEVLNTEEEYLLSTLKISNQNYKILVNLNRLDQYSKEGLQNVLKHELVHIISTQSDQLTEVFFDSKQVDTKEKFLFMEKSCLPNYFSSQYGCFMSGSLVSQFFKKFWIGELLLEYNSINERNYNNEENYNKEILVWQAKHENKFVSSKAMENAEEDLAETFAFCFEEADKLSLNNIEISQTAKEKLNFVCNNEEFLAIKNSILAK